MGRSGSTATKDEILNAFQTTETLKDFAARIKMSPNTLRVIWKEAFGEEAFLTRCKTLQAAAASFLCKNRTKPSVYPKVPVPCSRCGVFVLKSSISAGKMDKSTFLCVDCKNEKYERNVSCPVCGLLVNGKEGLSRHFGHRRKDEDQAHIQHQEAQEAALWAGKTPNVDYATCLECGHRAKTLVGHINAVHGIDVLEYQDRYPGAIFQSSKTHDTKVVACKNRFGGYGKGDRKTVVCPSCGISWEGSKFLVPGTHDLRCESCRTKEDVAIEEQRWIGKSEPKDYVTCEECGYRAESLVSHLQNAHPDYQILHPDALVVALILALRDKTAIRGVPRSPEFAQHLREIKRIDLTLEDFQPFLEPDGTVDTRSMTEKFNYCSVTLKKYMEELGLKATNKYMEQSQIDRTVFLTLEELLPFKLQNGRINLAKATIALGYSHPTIKKECLRHNLGIAHGNITQAKCLNAVSVALGNAHYQEEWNTARFVNPETGRRLRFDGYFEAIGLVVEFHGHQHYQFPNAFMKSESYRPLWEKMCERDRLKKKMIQDSSDLTYFEVLENEPFTDVNYLKSRLIAEGIMQDLL